MRKCLAAIVIASGLAAPAFAADLAVKLQPVATAPASPWDVAFGVAIMSDYNFRGISQSDRHPSGSAYVEPRYNVTKDLQLYTGIAAIGVDLAQKPLAEIDLYAGIRPTFGLLALDLGALYYWYPSGELVLYPNGNISLANQSYWEVYGKATFTVSDMLSVGANVFGFSSWLNTGASGYFASATAKVTLPPLANGVAWSLSGEFGHLELGATKIAPPVYLASIPLPDYETWNLGVTVTLSKLALDLRYYDTNLSKGECNILTGDPGAVFAGDTTPFNNGNVSKWCSAAVVAKLSVDLTLADLK